MSGPLSLIGRKAMQLKDRLVRLWHALLNVVFALGSLLAGLILIELILRAFFTPTLAFRPDPHLGWTHVPDQTAWDVSPGEYRIRVRVNSNGLVDDEHAHQKPSDMFRILVLGDSFTEATQVRHEEAYHSLLEASLNQRCGRPVEVINGGVRAYGTVNELLFFQHEGVRYQPDVVLLAFFVGNDVVENSVVYSDELRSGISPYYTLEDGQLRLHNYPAPKGQRIATELRNQRRTLRLWRFVGDFLITWPPALRARAARGTLALPPNDFVFAPVDEQPAEVRDAWDLTLALLVELNAQAEASDAQLAVVLIPASFQVNPEVWALREELFPQTADWDPSVPNMRLAEALGEEAMLLDLTPSLREYAASHPNNPLYYARDRGHWTPEAHTLAARTIEEFLFDEGLLAGCELR